MKDYVKSLLGAAAALALLSGTALAQVPSLPPAPYNVDLGALITNAARVPGTTNSAAQNNLANKGVICTLNQTAQSGSPSTAINIQMQDAASQQWLTLATTGAATQSVNTPVAIIMHPGAPSTALTTPTITSSLHLPRTWRVQQVTTGSNTTQTGTVDCNLLN